MSSMYEIAIPYHKKTVGSRIAKGFDDFANRGVSVRVILNHVKKLAGRKVLVTSARSDAVDPNTINVNGYYDPDEDEDGGVPIELVLVFNPEDKLIKMGRNEWREFAAEMIEYLQHEAIHRYQYRQRGYQPTRSYKSKAVDPEQKKRQEYLGNTDEIEAYAHNLASELDRKTKGDLDAQMRLLRHIANTAITRDQAGRLLSANLYGYFKDFDFDVRHPVLRSLMKKTYQYVVAKKRKIEKDKRIADRNTDIANKEKLFQERKEALDRETSSSYTVIVEK
jgi:hypothetical protein